MDGIDHLPDDELRRYVDEIEVEQYQHKHVGKCYHCQLVQQIQLIYILAASSPPDRNLMPHGCGIRAYMDVFIAISVRRDGSSSTVNWGLLFLQTSTASSQTVNCQTAVCFSVLPV